MSLDVSLFKKNSNILFGTMQEAPAKCRRLHFESLENRELLSVSPLLPSMFSNHNYSASQAFVADNFDVMSSSATSYTTSYPSPESCFVLLGGSLSIVGCPGDDEDFSELVVFQGIDGTATIMSFTCMSTMSIDSGEEYWNKTYSENRWETWGWTIPDGVSNTDALRDFTFTGTTCCGEMSANVHICMVPEFVSDIDEELSAPLPKNVDYYSHYILADAEIGETTTGKIIEADYLHSVTYSLISQKDAYGNDVELFDFDDGVITTAVSLANEENLTDTYTLVVKASDSYHTDLPEQYDLATVTISLVDINFIPYTPETMYIDPIAIPEDNWKANE
ncbi:MAG: cadherin repeat domain-containing protein, partial [Planctomycetaceae bacterium]|nr:cadherin repeat domain-containing protein [Planctomycetaceae bacterium]